MKNNSKLMTEGAPWRHIVRFAFPVLAGSLLQQLYNTVDAVIVGRFTGEDALSAVGTTGSMTFLFLALAIGFSSGNCVITARFFGAGDDKKVRESASTGIIFLLMMGLAATVIGAAVSGPALRVFLSTPGEILDMTLVYFRIYALGFIFQFGYNIFSAILRAVGDSSATLYFLLISSVANILLDLLLVAVFDMGVTGAAIATDISQLGSFVAAYIYMNKKYPVFRFKMNEYTFRPEIVGKTVKIGMPIALQLVIVSMGQSFIQRAVNEFGKSMTASYTVGQRIEQYINLPALAMQTTMATYTGQNIGAGKRDRISKGLFQGLAVSLSVTLVISALIFLFPDSIINLFGLSPEAAGYCEQHLRATAFINIILCLYVPVFGVYQGMGHSAFPTAVACCALGMRVATTYMFRYSPFLGYSVIWWSGLFGFGTGFTVTWIYYATKKWQKLK